MKIFIGANNSCNLSYHHIYVIKELERNFEITTDIKEADIIVIAETCCTTEYNLYGTLNYIDLILDKKRKDAKVFLTGCITRKFKHPDLVRVEKWLKEKIDFIIPQNNPDLLLQLISKNVYEKFDKNYIRYLFTHDSSADICITNGCLNNCSFCKITYQDYPLKSVDLSELKEVIASLDMKNFSEINLKGTNICQYGLDIYGKSMLPEVIDYLEKSKNIKRISLTGFSFQDAIKNDFQEVFANSTKIVEIGGSLETGSDRLLKLIKKGFTSEEIINFVRGIREKTPKELYLNIIAGLPTETLDDVKRTLEVLKELAPYMVDVCRYTNSTFVDSNRYEQLSPREIQHHTRVYSKVLRKRNVGVDIVGYGYKYNRY